MVSKEIDCNASEGMHLLGRLLQVKRKLSTFISLYRVLAVGKAQIKDNSFHFKRSGLRYPE